MRTMLSLIWKDFYNGIVGNWLVVFLWAVFSITNIFFALGAGMISLNVVSISIGLDEKSKIDSLYSSLPIKRSDYVLAKYLSTFSIMVIVALSFFLTRLILNSFFIPGSHKSITIRDIFYLVFPVTILISLYFPVHFKMGGGMEKSARFIVVVVLLVIGVGAIGFLVIYSIEIDVFNIKYIYLYLTAIMMVFLAGSVGLSMKFYAKRDL